MKKVFLVRLFIIFILFSPATFVFAGELPEDYQARKADEKISLLWKQCEATEYKESIPALDGTGWGGILKQAEDFFSDKVKKLNSIDLAPTFDHISDELPSGRIKIIHPYGSVVLATFNPSKEKAENIISGLLSTKNEKILIRLSLAGDPAGMAGFTPGMAIKFLIDGKSSRNIFVMPTLEGQDADTNFFKYSFSNDLPEPFKNIKFNWNNPLDPKNLEYTKIIPKKTAFALIEKYFGLFHETPRHLSTDFLTNINQKGEVIDDKEVKTPFILEFRPVYNKIKPDSPDDFRSDLAAITVGATLFDIYAQSSKDEAGVYIGSLKTRSRFISSNFSDKSLFFQHHH